VVTLIIGISILVFLILRVIPGDAVLATLGTEVGALTPEQLASLRSFYGVDQPLLVQYFSWIGSMLSGNFGYSVISGRSVLSLTLISLPVTMQLALLATVFGAVMGVALGMLSASKPGSIRDFIGQGSGIAFLALPSFVAGSAIVVVMAERFGYFPNALPYAAPWEDPWLNFQQMMFPAFVLSLTVAAPVMRTTRASLLDMASQDFIRTAEGKGLSRARVQWRHLLPNSLLPVITMTGMQFGYLLGGAIIVEQIFAMPGLGRQVLTGILQRDYSVVQSTTMLIAVMFVVVNLVTDSLYRRVDPRIGRTIDKNRVSA
jgi:peptide/nickel transport system permease protein